MRTARSSMRRGCLTQAHLTPGSRHPLGADTPQQQTTPQSRPPGADPHPGSRHPPGEQTPLLLWKEFLAHAYENITLPKTSFAGGNKFF